MKAFSKGKDGGPESHVTGYFLVEIKRLFSIVLLKFDEGTREEYHNHAFNAVTLWLKGEVQEEYPDHIGTTWKAGELKYTPRNLMHRIRAFKPAYALSFRGPWVSNWNEYNAASKRTTTLTHGRKIVNA